MREQDARTAYASVWNLAHAGEMVSAAEVTLAQAILELQQRLAALEAEVAQLRAARS